MADGSDASGTGSDAPTPLNMDGLQVLARTLAQTMEVTLGATMDNFLTRLDAKLDDHLETPLGASGSSTGATATPTHRTTPPPTGKHIHTSSRDS